MKRLFLLLMSMCALAASAQNEISFSYGVIPLGNKFMPKVLVISDIFSSENPPKDIVAPVRFEDVKSFGTLNAMYLRSFTDKLSAGASYSYSCFKPDYIIPHLKGYCDTKVHSHSIMLTAKWKWVNRKRISLYSRIGAGIRINKAKIPKERAEDDRIEYVIEKTSKTDFAWQISALGADYKIFNNFMLFAEAGAGMQGCIQAGVKVAF